MSSSEPPSTSPALGQCVVCGKETAVGCSVCKRAGLDWMYFCSVEHQRLIWHVHKRVCGKNPFEWPPLTEEEAKEAWELRNSPLSPVSPMTWSDLVISAMMSSEPEIHGPLLKEGADVLFRTFLESISASNSNQVDESRIRLHRGTALSVKITAFMKQPVATKKDLVNLLKEEAVGYAAGHAERLIEDHLVPDDWTFTSDFQHRLLIFTVLVIDMSAVAEGGLEAGRLSYRHYVDHSISVLTSLDMSKLSKTEPEKAREAVRSMIDTVLIQA
ncbi:zinc finger MYND domain-containing protein [Sporobolomyces salmoneus]|uniref:zinc finger MYND domain-containing protein n=1 Tax=Sporobolomyces salmoneus TaxID=183962 RepID=UPI0031757BE9